MLAPRWSPVGVGGELWAVAHKDTQTHRTITEQDLCFLITHFLVEGVGVGGRQPGSIIHCKTIFFFKLFFYEPNGDKMAVGRGRFSLFRSIQFMLLTGHEGLVHFWSARHVVLAPLSALGCEDLSTGALMGGPQGWQTHLETRDW